MKTAIVLLLLTAPSMGQNRACKTNPQTVAACYVVHGRAAYGNGTPALRIWIVGTNRILGVTAESVADDAEMPITPKNMVMKSDEQLFGDFEVCPFTPEMPGHMRMVCVESATHLVVKK